MRSKADETFVIVETLICPLQISHPTHSFVFDFVNLFTFQCKLLDKENQFSKTKADGRIASLRDKVNELEQKSSDKEQKLNLVRCNIFWTLITRKHGLWRYCLTELEWRSICDSKL